MNGLQPFYRKKDDKQWSHTPNYRVFAVLAANHKKDLQINQSEGKSQQANQTSKWDWATAVERRKRHVGSNLTLIGESVQVNK